MKEAKLFMTGVNALPVPWRAWVMLLVAANLVVPLFFMARPEAQAVLAALAASMILMLWLVRIQGFTRLVGLGHVFWVPLIYFLWSRFDQVPPVDFYGLWMRAVVVLNSLSLIVDAVDLARYIRGERASLIPGSARE